MLNDIPKKQRKNIIGIAITGGGFLITPFTMNKIIIVANALLFIYFVFAGMKFNLNQSKLTLDDLNDTIQNSFDEAYTQKKYGKMALYASVQPAIILGLIAIVLTIVAFILG